MSISNYLMLSLFDKILFIKILDYLSQIKHKEINTRLLIQNIITF